MSVKDKIPKEFKLFGTIISVKVENDKMNDKQSYGESSYSESKIYMSTTCGLNELSHGKIMDTFYHEKVHIILDSMHQYELSKDEQFVDVFSKLLRQSDVTAKF